MALPRVSARLPFYDPSKCSLAFGDRAISKLVRALGTIVPHQSIFCFVFQNRDLHSSDVSVRQQSLLLLDDVLHKRENLAAALTEGIYFRGGGKHFYVK